MPGGGNWKPQAIPVGQMNEVRKKEAHVAAEQKKMLLRAGGKAAFGPKAALKPAKPK